MVRGASPTLPVQSPKLGLETSVTKLLPNTCQFQMLKNSNRICMCNLSVRGMVSVMAISWFSYPNARRLEIGAPSPKLKLKVLAGWNAATLKSGLSPELGSQLPLLVVNGLAPGKIPG